MLYYIRIILLCFNMTSLPFWDISRYISQLIENRNCLNYTLSKITKIYLSIKDFYDFPKYPLLKYDHNNN